MKIKSATTKATNRRKMIMAICLAMGLAMLFAFVGLGNSGYKQQGDAKAYVLQNHTSQTGAQNAVTAVYLNYRLWDTLFESMLLLLSALAVISFSWSSDHEE